MLGAVGLFSLWALVAGARWATGFQDSVALPNGMQLVREFDWSRHGRWTLLATDGKRALVRTVEFNCFNDRYIFVRSYDGAMDGLYDAKTDGRLPMEYSEAMNVSDLRDIRGGCNGYLTGWLGPELLLKDGRKPFVLPCAWRNIGNAALLDRTWFDRPCD